MAAKHWALFWVIYFLMLPTLIIVLASENAARPFTIIVAIVWWLLCFPGLAIIFDVILSLKRKK